MEKQCHTILEFTTQGDETIKDMTLGWEAYGTLNDAKDNQLFYAGHGETLFGGLLAIDAPVMIIHTDEDLGFPGNAVRETASIIKSDGTPVQVIELEGIRGYLDGVLSISQAGPQIEAFLGK